MQNGVKSTLAVKGTLWKQPPEKNDLRLEPAPQGPGKLGNEVNKDLTSHEVFHRWVEDSQVCTQEDSST